MATSGRSRLRPERARARGAALALAALLAVSSGAVRADWDPGDEAVYSAQASGSARDTGTSPPEPSAAPGAASDGFLVEAWPAPLVSAAEETIVTSRRRAETLQKTPVSVSAFTSAELRQRQVRRLDEASGKAGNLFLGTTGGLSNSARASLRGTGQNEPDSFLDPGVAVYVDGVYLARSQGQLQSLADIETVEVIRGPQGTLFGKNALGGAIHVVTRKPEFERGGEAELRVGNYDRLDTRFTVNVPLVEEFAAARFTLLTRTRDGYVENQINSDEYSDDKTLGARLQLLVLPRSDMEVLISADQSIQDRKPLGSKCMPVGSAPGLVAVPAAATGFVQACAQDGARSELKTASDLSFAQDDLRSYGASVQVSWDVTPAVTLTSISALRNQDNERFLDADSSPINFAQPQADSGQIEQSQLSQELRVNGRALGGRLNYVAGVYGFREKAEERTLEGLSFLPLRREEFRVNNLSYDAFGQLAYSFTPRLELAVGIRRNQERKRVRQRERVVSDGPVALDPQAVRRAAGTLPDSVFDAIGRLLPTPIPTAQVRAAFMDPALLPLIVNPRVIGQITGSLNTLAQVERSQRFDEWTPSATLSYRFGAPALVYAAYSTGFRSGGFSGRGDPLNRTGEIEPEELTSYEVGLKSVWLDGRLVLNGSLFYNVARDVQLGLLSVDAQIGVTTLQRRNASKQLIRGGELELAWLPLPGLTLGVDLGVLRSKYVEFDDDVPDASLEDEQPAIAPNYTMGFSAQYEVPVPYGRLGLRADWTHTGSYNSDADGTDALRVGKFGVLDARVSLALLDERTELALFGTNLLDRRYFTSGNGFASTFGYVTRFYAPPRMYGLELRRSF